MPLKSGGTSVSDSVVSSLQNKSNLCEAFSGDVVIDKLEKRASVDSTANY